MPTVYGIYTYVSDNRIMMTTKKIIPGLFIMIFLACSCSIAQQEKAATDKQSTDNYMSNLSYVGGNYRIDTNAILNNHNLNLLIEDLEKADLAEKKTVAEIPALIKSFLDSLTGNFLIANPGEDWQAGCIKMGKQIQKKVYNKETGDTLIQITFDNSQPLPSRQLIYWGLGNDLALMSYYTGGWGKSEHILIFKFNDSKIIDFWCGTILTDVTNKSAILKYLKENKDKEWGLNTNIISI